MGLNISLGTFLLRLTNCPTTLVLFRTSPGISRPPPRTELFAVCECELVRAAIFDACRLASTSPNSKHTHDCDATRRSVGGGGQSDQSASLSMLLLPSVICYTDGNGCYLQSTARKLMFSIYNTILSDRCTNRKHYKTIY